MKLREFVKIASQLIEAGHGDDDIVVGSYFSAGFRTTLVLYDVIPPTPRAFSEESDVVIFTGMEFRRSIPIGDGDI